MVLRSGLRGGLREWCCVSGAACVVLPALLASAAARSARSASSRDFTPKGRVEKKLRKRTFKSDSLYPSPSFTRPLIFKTIFQR